MPTAAHWVALPNEIDCVKR